MFSKLIVGCLAAASVEAAAPATLHLPVQRSRLHNTLSKRNDTVQASLANQLQLYTIEGISSEITPCCCDANLGSRNRHSSSKDPRLTRQWIKRALGESQLLERPC